MPARAYQQNTPLPCVPAQDPERVRQVILSRRRRLRVSQSSWSVLRWLPRSDLKPHGNDRLGDDPQAGVVVAGVPAHALVGLFDGQ